MATPEDTSDKIFEEENILIAEDTWTCQYYNGTIKPTKQASRHKVQLCWYYVAALHLSYFAYNIFIFFIHVASCDVIKGLKLHIHLKKGNKQLEIY
uniref:Uncharacterized protein n=1 Tax=Amphimedon queenslandica TaxID=400682 RepID=A0A1X7VSQ3_AMPQE